MGIMSMQRIFNYGSFLQAYSLKKIIENLGCFVEFIDYHPGEPVVLDNKSFRLPKVDKVLATLKISAPLKEKIKYIRYKKNYAYKYFPLLKLDTYNYSTDKLDVLIIGSDEVFNCVQSNPNVGLAPDLFGQENEATKLISYAASFGNTTFDKLEEYGLESRISKWLNDFNRISVRDQNSFNIVRRLIGKQPVINLDPVLIYFNKRNLQKVKRSIKVKDKYLLLYGYNGRFSNEECERIRKFANLHNLKVYCIGGLQNYCDSFIDCDPFEVLSYFEKAEFIITDTFHGTIMSIINQKNFITLVRNSGYGNSQKLDDLLEKVKLKSRKLTDLSKLDQYLACEIDYTTTNRILDNERKKSISYLMEEVI
ncbi:polysaccharide pyruvyl transferase family protein [Limosilactobacillus reuteri]|uniref:polysaccharide pyruvyl transferase family protein n=1 Tax=Limosilactobacillus reuteri TaxID=1598 RepID=UPI002AFE1B8B|nr:polysaccharide pyruvyl transferase family protein [Limosilactobacillus reuteri]